jgi:hypothetical protein
MPRGCGSGFLSSLGGGCYESSSPLDVPLETAFIAAGECATTPAKRGCPAQPIVYVRVRSFIEIRATMNELNS